MTLSLDDLRRDARLLGQAHAASDPIARQRLANFPPRPDLAGLKHADFLHVVAREQGYASWPALKTAAEAMGLTQAQALARVKRALWEGHHGVAQHLLTQHPGLAQVWEVQLARYDRAAVAQVLGADPGAATRPVGGRLPVIWLAFSRHHQAAPEATQDMLDVAQMLVAAGADVNASMPVAPDNDHALSALYGAIGHGNNMALGRWLLAQGADPNDGESLYHATELGHHEGLRMLLDHGADPKGTNALQRAMDFDDVEAVKMLLGAGALVEEFNEDPVGGETPWVIPALHQAARRMCGADMVALLLDQGADPGRVYEGASAYGYACVFGNDVLAKAIEARGAPPPLTATETLLARAVTGPLPPDRYVDPAQLPEAYRNILRLILHLPGKLEHCKRLVALGLEYDRPDRAGLTPVQVAGWEGLPEVMGYFLEQKPDLAHINGYGGGLIDTIIHGSENCPDSQARGHIDCLRAVLHEGLALSRRQIAGAGRDDVRAFLEDWAERFPAQVV